MNLRKSGIRICREKQHNSGNSVWSAVFLCAVCVSMLSLAWWNAFLSVFLPGVDASWLYRSLIVLAVILTMFDRRLGGWALLPEILCAGGFLWFNRELLRELISYGNVTDLRLTGMLTAAAMVPLMALWVIVFRSGKGRFAAGLLMTAPYIAAACLGYFQDMVPGWLLFLSGVLYFACSSAGEFRAQIPAILVLFAAVTVISVYGGRTLDAGRETEGGFYQTARNTIETELIGKVEQLIYGERRDESERFPQLPEEAAGPEDAEQAEEQESASADGNALAQGENFSPQEESGMDDLKSIGAFVPAEGVLGTVVVQTRPGQTYYEARRIGIEYTGGGWEQGNLSYLGRQQDLSGEELEQYLTCPDGLDRMESLCADWDTGSREAVSEQIDEALLRIRILRNIFCLKTRGDSVCILPQLQRLSTGCAVIRPDMQRDMPSRRPRLSSVRTADMRRGLTGQWDMHGVRCTMKPQECGWTWNTHRLLPVLFRTGRIPPGQIRQMERRMNRWMKQWKDRMRTWSRGG